MGTIAIDGATVTVAPDGLASVTEEQPIPYQAILSASVLSVYFAPALPATAQDWPAGRPLGIESNTRLASTATCFIFGERSV